MGLQRHLTRFCIAWAALVTFMMIFQPQKLPVVILIVPFVLLFWALYTLWQLFFAMRIRFTAKETGPSTGRLGVAICMTTVFLIILQSLGQLTVRDVLTILAIVLIGYAYVARNLARTPNR
jgi:hypothetical protein